MLRKQKQKKIEAAVAAGESQKRCEMVANARRSLLAAETGRFRGYTTSRVEARRAILRSKFKLLQDYLKL